MNILLEDGLPEEIDGAPIFPDFRNMIRFELLLQDEKVPEAAKLSIGPQLLFEDPPQDIFQGVQQLLWFYGGGCETEKKEKKTAAPPPRAYDFEQDAALIHAAFLSTYGIDLAAVEYLHWWEFLSLLTALPDSTPMGMVMYYRTVDLDEIKDKGTRKSLEEKKRRWQLKPLFQTKAANSQELERNMKERVRRRTEQARLEMEAARKEGGLLDHGIRRHTGI